MYVTPQSIIGLCHDVPLDADYRNTIHFVTPGAQNAYFVDMQKYRVQEYSYQRQNGTIRMGLEVDHLWDCNYLMFQNKAYGSKWFYAFITKLEYISDTMTEITFELDVMQTWMFDYEIRPSFVEREHASNDVIGANLVPESLETGDYTTFINAQSGHMNPLVIVFAATFDENMEDVTGGMYGGIYSGLNFVTFGTPNAANKFIEDAVVANKADGIISCFMMPQDFVTNPGQGAKTYTVSQSKSYTNIDGYVPHNNKLFTYPYNYLYVTNMEGSFAEFRYEYFSTDNCGFELAGCMNCAPQIILTPKNYKGVATNYNEKILLEGFPQCTYTTDAFKAWLAQNAGTVGFNGGFIGNALFGDVGKAIAGNLNLGALQGGGINAFESVAKSLNSAAVKLNQPPQAQGASSSMINSALRIKDFIFQHVTIRREFAEIIDGYFDMYGYATHKVKVPNRTGRPHWNYVLTKNVCIVGSIPAPDLQKIRSIYDSGVTFWKNGSEVGNYNLINK